MTRFYSNVKNVPKNWFKNILCASKVKLWVTVVAAHFTSIFSKVVTLQSCTISVSFWNVSYCHICHLKCEPDFCPSEWEKCAVLTPLCCTQFYSHKWELCSNSNLFVSVLFRTLSCLRSSSRLKACTLTQSLLSIVPETLSTLFYSCMNC